MMKRENYNIMASATLNLAAIAFGGLGMLFPPEGEIHDSVLLFVAELLVAAAVYVGLEPSLTKFFKKKLNFNSSFAQDVRKIAHLRSTGVARRERPQESRSDFVLTPNPGVSKKLRRFTPKVSPPTPPFGGEGVGGGVGGREAFYINISIYQKKYIYPLCCLVIFMQFLRCKPFNSV